MPTAAALAKPSHERHVRVQAEFAGRYILGSWRDQPAMRGVSMSCRTRQVATDQIILMAQYGGNPGDSIHIALPKLGFFYGTITRVMGPAKYVTPIMLEHEKASLASKIKWLHRQGGNIVGIEGRRWARYTPTEPFSMILMGDGTLHDCYVVDVSPVGALVTTEVLPEIGTVLALGKVVGRVVRHSEMGFGLEFIELQNPYTLDADILPPPSWTARRNNSSADLAALNPAMR